MISAAQGAGLNKTVIEKWFEGHEQILTELQIKDLPSHMWNCDETGLQDHFVSPRIVAEVGSACHEVTAGEKGETTTVLTSFNAAGDFRPLLVIFKA